MFTLALSISDSKETLTTVFPARSFDCVARWWSQRESALTVPANPTRHSIKLCDLAPRHCPRGFGWILEVFLSAPREARTTDLVLLSRTSTDHSPILTKSASGQQTLRDCLPNPPPATRATMELDEQGRSMLHRQVYGLSNGGDRDKRSLLQYATLSDVYVLAVSSISALVAGALNPLLTVRSSSSFAL